MPAEKPIERAASASAPDHARYPNVDRLIELGRGKDEKVSSDPDPKEPRDRDKSMWKLLLQLRPFLPYLTRLVPVLDVVAAPLQNAGMTSDMRKAVAESVAESTSKLKTELQSSQRDIAAGVTSTLEKQSLQIKRLEDELARIRHAADKFATDQGDIARDVNQLARLVRLSAAWLGVLIFLLIVMTCLLLVHLLR
jgi:hypothetical protein